ncbi:hypothetical protein LJR220_004420 [Bradyrhizobium sp. LjRoot220]|uniref:hypothetical protein n=1 Tax=Bradyrhizobium sp. LjRoot220 TaxID=3342284 RepID=UPI003ECCC16F
MQTTKPFTVIQNGKPLFTVHAYSIEQARALVAAKIAGETIVVAVTFPPTPQSLESTSKLAYLSSVRCRLTHRMRGFARTMMFLAVSAFMLQGTLIAVSQASAAAGLMLEPSVTLNGTVHIHDRLAGHVHDHDHSDVGHVHDPAAPDYDFDGANSSFWTIFGASVTVSTFDALVIPFDFAGRVEPPAVQRANGVEPDALTRPPRTLSIAC